MIICPSFHEMDMTVDGPLASLAGHYIESKSLQSDSPPHSTWSENLIDKNGMSITFRQVFQNCKESTKSADLMKIRTRPQSKHERIADAFNTWEHLLSNDNVRPKSRSRISDSSIQNDSSHSAVLHSHISDDKIRKIFSINTDYITATEGEAFTPEKENIIEKIANNASEKKNTIGLNTAVSKKGKKSRKRTKSESKNKRVKPARLSVPATRTHHDHDKRLSTHSVNKLSTLNCKNRISSEPINSKPNLHSNALSYTLQGFDSERTNKHLSFPCNNRSASDLVHVPSDKTKASNNDKQIIPSTNYTHGSVETNSRSHKDSLEALQIRIQPLTAQKVELNKRIKSGHSIRSEVDSIHASIYPLDTKPSSPVFMTNSVNLTTKSSNLPQMNTENVHVVMHGNSVKQKNVSSSKECVSKESSLAAIYGPQNNIPQRAYSNADDFRKVKKIFLSEKQSGTLKENGMEFPCAPPATPVPDVMKRYEYVPCMNDIRKGLSVQYSKQESQRAVKNKLQVMERDAIRKKEKQKETLAKLEKQQIKDREKILKAQQRKEIYALNKIMTELEHNRFLEFCLAKGLNT